MPSFDVGESQLDLIRGPEVLTARIRWRIRSGETSWHLNLPPGVLPAGQLYELVFAPVSSVSGSYTINLYDEHGSDLLPSAANNLGNGSSPVRKYLYQEIILVNTTPGYAGIRYVRPLLLCGASPYRLQIAGEADKAGLVDLRILLPPLHI